MVRSGNTVLKSLNGDDDDVVYSGEEIRGTVTWRFLQARPKKGLK